MRAVLHAKGFVFVRFTQLCCTKMLQWKDLIYLCCSFTHLQASLPPLTRPGKEKQQTDGHICLLSFCQHAPCTIAQWIGLCAASPSPLFKLCCADCQRLIVKFRNFYCLHSIFLHLLWTRCFMEWRGGWAQWKVLAISEGSHRKMGRIWVRREGVQANLLFPIWTKCQILFFNKRSTKISL